MAQMTWRASDELLDRVRQEARHEGQTLNDFVSRVMAAVTDPALEGDDVERMRRRLRAAGVLADTGPRVASRPPESAVALARAAAGRGRPLSDYLERR